MAPTPEEMAAKAEEKRAKQEAAKAERDAKRAEEKAAKAEAKAAEKARLAEEREAVKQAREAEKAARKAEREANKMPEQNDVRRPQPETKTGRIWAVLDERSTAEGRPVAISEVFADLVGDGHPEPTIRTQYARWRKFHGITGRIDNPNKAPKPTKAAKAQTDEQSQPVDASAETDGQETAGE